jgi:glycosyltransferase involved in cell wall biosynthesis
MRCPTLSELPPPPPGKTGFPWTAESQQLPTRLPDGSEYPRISIVTPNYNYGRFIEETIRSVLLQGYPNLEYIIIDGGSTDDSVEIIKKYEPWLAYWVSESDRGQASAINKGFNLVSGEVMGWLNSDDQFQTSAFYAIAQFFYENPTKDFVVGQSYWIDQRGKFLTEHTLKVQCFYDLIFLIQGKFLAQPSVLFRNRLFKAVGPINEELHYVMDSDYWLRIGLNLGMDKSIPIIENGIAIMIAHENQKTTSKNEVAMEEAERVVKKYLSSYGIKYLAKINYQMFMLQSKAFRVWSTYKPDTTQKNLETLFSLSRLWLQKIPAYLLTLSYIKFAVRCAIHK